MMTAISLTTWYQEEPVDPYRSLVPMRCAQPLALAIVSSGFLSALCPTSLSPMELERQKQRLAPDYHQILTGTGLGGQRAIPKYLMTICNHYPCLLWKFTSLALETLSSIEIPCYFGLKLFSIRKLHMVKGRELASNFDVRKQLG